jgi:hypothetical protein
MIASKSRSQATPPKRSGPLASRTKLAIASFIIHYLGSQARNRFLGHLPAMATVRSSGWSLRNAPNGIPRPWRVYRY